MLPLNSTQVLFGVVSKNKDMIEFIFCVQYDEKIRSDVVQVKDVTHWHVKHILTRYMKAKAVARPLFI